MWKGPPEDTEKSKPSSTSQVDASRTDETNNEVLVAEPEGRGQAVANVVPVPTIATMGVESLVNLGGHLPLAAALLNSSANALCSTNPEAFVQQLQSLRTSGIQPPNEALLGILGMASAGVRAPYMVFCSALDLCVMIMVLN
jgi:hypothetical protein